MPSDQRKDRDLVEAGFIRKTPGRSTRVSALAGLRGVSGHLFTHGDIDQQQHLC